MTLGCAEGRSTTSWVDFDFWGNQISAHLGERRPAQAHGHVDGVAVPIPHLGASADPDYRPVGYLFLACDTAQLAALEVARAAQAAAGFDEARPVTPAEGWRCRRGSRPPASPPPALALRGG